MRRLFVIFAALIGLLVFAGSASATLPPGPYPPYAEASCVDEPANWNGFLTRCEAQKAMAVAFPFETGVKKVTLDGVNSYAVRPDSACTGFSSAASLRTEANLLLRFIGMPCKQNYWVGGGFTRSNDYSGTTGATFYDPVSRKWIRFLSFVTERAAPPTVNTCNNGWTYCVGEVATKVNLGSY